MSVIDFASARARKLGPDAPPPRDPDFELYGWLKDGDVEWVRFIRSDAWPDDMAPGHDWWPLVNAAWTWAKREDVQVARTDKPAFWYFVDLDGAHSSLFSTDLLKGTGWRHAIWMLRQWWRCSLRWWYLAGRALRGGG